MPAAMAVEGAEVAAEGIVSRIWRFLFGKGAAKAETELVAKSGTKLAQQIARWHEIGGQGGMKEFLQYAGRLADEARAAGNVVTGTVGKAPTR